MGIPALNGNEIGVFAWYAHGLAFTDGEYANLHAQLSDKSSESPDEYYDGTRNCTGVNDGRTHTIKMRVRKDGYILAWRENTVEPADDFDYTANYPITQRTIQQLMSAAGVSGFAWVKCYYYNFLYPNASEVRWFGRATNLDLYYHPITETFYFTLPASGMSFHYVKQKCYTKCIASVGHAFIDVLTHGAYNPLGVENTIRCKRWRNGAKWCYCAVTVNGAYVAYHSCFGFNSQCQAKTVVVAFTS